MSRPNYRECKDCNCCYENFQYHPAVDMFLCRLWAIRRVIRIFTTFARACRVGQPRIHIDSLLPWEVKQGILPLRGSMKYFLKSIILLTSVLMNP
jgi:hypothetical protein